MAAPELNKDDDDICIHVESDLTTSNPSTTPRSNPRPTRHSNGSLSGYPSLSMSQSPVDTKQEHQKSGDWLKPFNLLCNRQHRSSDYIKIPLPEEGVDPLPTEWWKTGVSLVYAAAMLVLTTVVITIVHERVPDKSVSPPLPDKFFDYIDRVPGTFTVTEAHGLILMGVWSVQWFFLKHRAIVARRCFFLIGTLYFYRCVTMYITTLPVPSTHLICAPKLYGDSTAKVRRILRVMSGGGLSLTGTNVMCGDYLYSGHTIMLMLSYLFIKEYSPSRGRFSWLWKLYRCICWCLSFCGIICILIAREHYSIDVVIAYFVITRSFWWYHAMIESRVQNQTPNSFLCKTWWYRVFDFLEKNVKTTVPIEFSWPVRLPSCSQRYLMVDKDGGRDD
ncbi:phosphatidylcholine:ceramide cholinephosphotransferase 2 [Pholidichthys leucotaenia]